LKYLNVNCQLKGGLFCKIGTRVSYHIKRKREEKGGSQPEGRNTNSPLYKPEIMLSSIFKSSCSIDMQG
jgi:hypothetical protein